MLLTDGRLGLIDYGQVKTMSVKERINLARLILAHEKKDKKEVVRLTFDVMGTITKKKDPNVAYLSSAFWFDRTTEDVMGDKNMHYFIEVTLRLLAINQQCNCDVLLHESKHLPRPLPSFFFLLCHVFDSGLKKKIPW